MINTVKDLNLLREVAKAKMEGFEQQILICGGTGCTSSGSLKLFEKLKKKLQNTA